MVVVCQKCRTRFQLDEARIPAKGVRVRCSKCKHAFFVAPPATEDSTLHRLAQQAAATGRPAKPKPGPQVDLPGPGEAEESRFAAAAAAAGEAEDDWEFNTDTPGGEGDDSTPPPAEITDSEPTENDAVDSFFELDGLRDPGPERGGDAPAAPAPQAARTAPPAQAPKPAASAPKAAAAKPARAKSPIEPEQEVGFEDLGDPESWDFGSPARRSEAPPAAKPKPSPKSQKARPPVAAAAAPLRAPSAATRPPPIGRAGAIAHAVAWVLAFGLFGFGLRGVLAPGEAAARFPATALGGLEVGSLQVRHVENFWAGPLVVVAGELRNPGGAPAKVGAVPRLRIRDAAGASLEVASPWLGAELGEAALREEDPADLGAELGRSARALAERSFAPGESVRVQAVLAGLPPGAAGFAVEGAPLASLPAEAPASLPAEAPSGAPPATETADPVEGAPADGEPAAGATAAP